MAHILVLVNEPLAIGSAPSLALRLPSVLAGRGHRFTVASVVVQGADAYQRYLRALGSAGRRQETPGEGATFDLDGLRVSVWGVTRPPTLDPLELHGGTPSWVWERVRAGLVEERPDAVLLHPAARWLTDLGPFPKALRHPRMVAVLEPDEPLRDLLRRDKIHRVMATATHSFAAADEVRLMIGKAPFLLVPPPPVPEPAMTPAASPELQGPIGMAPFTADGGGYLLLEVARRCPNRRFCAWAADDAALREAAGAYPNIELFGQPPEPTTLGALLIVALTAPAELAAVRYAVESISAGVPVIHAKEGELAAVGAGRTVRLRRRGSPTSAPGARAPAFHARAPDEIAEAVRELDDPDVYAASSARARRAAAAYAERQRREVQRFESWLEDGVDEVQAWSARLERLARALDDGRGPSLRFEPTRSS